MAYSSLIVKPLVALAGSDNSIATITDGTGTYPESEGGYAVPPDESATRPTFAETKRWVIYRRRNADGTWTEFIPTTQPDATSDPFSTNISLLDGDGNPYPDGVWQIFMMVVPVATSYPDTDFDTYIQDAMDLYGVGQVALYANATSVPCTNNALQEFNDKWTSGGCQCGAYLTKKALFQGVVSNLAIGESYQTPTLLSPVVTEWYQQGAVIANTLLNQCSTCSCCC